MIDDKFGNAPSLNEEKFKQAVYDGIIALDEIVSYGYETQPLDENRTCIDDWQPLWGWDSSAWPMHLWR